MDKDKRELTEKEWKRKDCFETLCSEMQQKGYKVKNVMINTQKAKYLALFVMLPFKTDPMRLVPNGSWGRILVIHPERPL